MAINSLGRIELEWRSIESRRPPKANRWENNEGRLSPPPEQFEAAVISGFGRLV